MIFAVENDGDDGNDDSDDGEDDYDDGDAMSTMP